MNTRADTHSHQALQQVRPWREIVPWHAVVLMLFMAWPREPVAPAAPTTPNTELARARERARLRRLIEAVLGATQWASPPPGTSVRSAVGMWALSTMLVLLLLLTY